MTVYRRANDVLHADVGNDVVALHVDRGHSYGMEDVTAAVWRLLSEPRDAETICEELMKCYDVAADTCRADVGRLLQQLENEGLVERVPNVSRENGG